MTFPADPNAPGGPRRSEHLRRAHADRTPVRDRFPTFTLAENDPPGTSAAVLTARPRELIPGELTS